MRDINQKRRQSICPCLPALGGLFFKIKKNDLLNYVLGKSNLDPIEKEMFESFMSQYTPNKYGVNYQSVTVTNIKEIHINGNEYKVVNP